MCTNVHPEFRLLIGKDGDDVINTVTCALTGTESISEHRVNKGNMASNRIYQLKL